MVIRRVRPEIDSLAFHVVVLVEVLRAERVVADHARLTAHLEVVDPFHVLHESLFGYDPAHAERWENPEAFPRPEHRRTGIVHDGLKEILLPERIVQRADQRQLAFAVGVSRALDRLQIEDRRRADPVVVVPVVVAQLFVQEESLMGPFAHDGLAGDLRPFVRGLDGRTGRLVVDHRRVVGILADAGHVEEVERRIGLELQPLEQGVQIVGQCGRNGARTSFLREEAVFGECGVGVGSVVLADAVDDVSGRLVARDDQRKFHRGRAHGPDERIVELRGGGRSAVAVARGAAEAQAAGESEVDLQVPRDGGVEVRADGQPVEVGRAPDLEDVPFAGIPQVGAVCEPFRSAVERDVGLVIGFRVLEHQTAVVGVRRREAVRIAEREPFDRFVGVERRVSAVDARLILQLRVFDAVDPLGTAVHHAHAAFEPHADAPFAGMSAAGGDVDYAAAGARSEEGLVGDVADERHGFDLLGIELQLRKVYRHAVNDERRRESPAGDRPAERLLPVVQPRHAAPLGDRQSVHDACEGVAQVV